MKKQILVLLFAITAGTSSFAQCDKKVTLVSSITEYLNSSFEVQRTANETTTIDFDSKEIFVTPGEQTMDGKINSITCDWKTAFKEGKTVIKTVLNGQNGQSMTATITIEGKDGKITLLAEFEESPDMKVRLVADKFEEIK